MALVAGEEWLVQGPGARKISQSGLGRPKLCLPHRTLILLSCNKEGLGKKGKT